MKKITPLKSLSFLIAFLSVISFGFGQTTLSEGDIAITGVNSDTPDEFSFVLLRDISSGTIINFTDKGWLANGGWRLNTTGNNVLEGILTWTATTDLPCGTVIIISEPTTNNYTSTDFVGNAVGTITESEPGFAISAAGDEILVYQGDIDEPTFLFAIHFANSNGWTDSTDNNTSALPSGLTESVNAIYIGNFDNGNYTCTVTSDPTLILAAVVNASNWYLTNSNTVTNRPVLGGCSYAVCAPAGTCGGLATTWNGLAWDNGTPDLTKPAIINGNYNSLTNGNINACSLTINPSLRLTVDNGSYVAVENNVIVDGELYVETQGNFVQNDAAGTFTVNAGGTALVNKSTPAKQDWSYYTYWSSPVNGETIAGAFPNTDADRRFSFNASNYIDSDGDDIDDDGNDWVIEAGGNTLTPGVGYAATESRFHPSGAAGVASFTGPFNTGDITTNIVYNVINTTGSWNFIGNPYPSAIDFIAFQSANSTVVDGAAYFWSQFTPPDATNPGNQLSNLSQNDYATFTVGTGGAAGASGVIPDQYIPSGQGFFISGLSNGNATFTNAIRMADATSNSQFFKTKKSKTAANFNKLWINLTTDNGVFNQILVGYVDGATDNNDGLYYDAPKLLSNEAAILYSKIENSNTVFVIQGKSPNSLTLDEVIKIGYKTTIEDATIYKLSIAQLEGAFLTGNPIYLKDNLLNKVHDLTVCDYTFTSEVGEFNTRFEIGFSSNALSIEERIIDPKSLRIVELENDRVQFNVSDNLSIKSVHVFDLLGRQLYNLKGNSSSETYNLSNLNDAIYIAKVELSNGAVITKKAVKK